MSEIVQSLIEAMSKAGCEPATSNEIQPTGQDTYYRLAGDKKNKRGGYCLTVLPDGFAYANFINFKTGSKGKWHSAQENKKLTKEEKEAIAKRIKQAEKDREARQEKIYDQSAIIAAEKCAGAVEAKDHPYLKNKKIKPYAIKQAGDLLIIPMSSGGKIWSYQTIDGEGEKLFLSGGRKKGCYYKIGKDTDTICIVEGVATGASVHEATGYCTYVAFDAYNLEFVADEVRKLHPDALIILVSDYDQWSVDQKGKPYNVGLIKAQQAATKINGFECHYEFPAYLQA